MRITVNGEPREVAGDLDVRGLLEQLGFGQGLVAVELNREVVPRARHVGTRLAEGDSVEIVHFVGGG